MHVASYCLETTGGTQGRVLRGRKRNCGVVAFLH